MHGQISVVRQLLAAGSDIGLRDERGSSALTWSLFGNHGVTSAELIACGAQLGLAEAVLLNDLTRVKDFLESGCDPDARVCWGSSLLALAAERGFMDCVSLLLNAGATVNDPESNALSYAAAKGDSEMVALLLDAGAEINFSDEEGNTALMTATLEGCESIVAFLLERGADPFARDVYRRSAADYAENPAIVELFSTCLRKPSDRAGLFRRLLCKFWRG
jgi:ankyrin repeat protein